jgi:hypothetical protein
MIDWYHLAANSLWIIACAIVLGTVSLASWEASTVHRKLIIVLSYPRYQILLFIAGLFFCLGIAGTLDRWWEIILWLLIALVFSGQIYRILARKQKE